MGPWCLLSPTFTTKVDISELITVGWQVLETRLYNFHFLRQVP